MHSASLASNPFALLTDPEAILRAVESSQHLESLNRRVCRPLDRLHKDENGVEVVAETGADTSLEAVLD